MRAEAGKLVGLQARGGYGVKQKRKGQGEYGSTSTRSEEGSASTMMKELSGSTILMMWGEEGRGGGGECNRAWGE